MTNTGRSHLERFMLKRLKLAREEAGLSQARVAQLLNKTQSYMSKIEAGKSMVHIAQLKEFSKIYKKRIGYLLK